MCSSNRDKAGRRFCCYRGCYSDKALTFDGAISFFSFPIKDTERCSKWISCCGREEFRYLNPRELSEKRICELHFHRGMFSNDFKTHLLKKAVPMDCRTVLSSEVIDLDDDDDEGDVERESGINTAESSENNETEVNELHSTNENSLLCSALINGTANFQNRDSVGEYLPSPEYVSVENRQFDVVTSTAECNNENNKTTSNQTKRPSLVATKFHNLPPQTTHTDFYYQQCQSAEETNNSFPEPVDGELPLIVQQEYASSEVDDPVNSVVSEPLAKKFKYDRDNIDLANLVKETVKQLKNITSTVLTNSEDEFEVFGRSVAIQLKKMSLCTALTVQAKIQDLLSQFRIKDINNAETKTNVPLENDHHLAVFESDQLEDSINRTIEQPSNENELEQRHSAPASPQLSRTCASEKSDTEIVE